MALARKFSILYAKVQSICQDKSSDGKAQAQDGINTVIKELTKKFDMPQMFKGEDNSVFVTPNIGLGTQFLTLANDVVRISNVWWIDTGETVWPLIEIISDSDWLDQTDDNSTGDPVVFRYFQQVNANATMQIWTSPNSGWVNKSTGLLYYSYWAQLAQLVDDGDIPSLPYELDTVLINGAVVEMARQQGDSVLIEMYEQKYQDDIDEIRAWIIKQHSKDGQMAPDQPQGTFGVGQGRRGYRIV